MSAVRVDTTTSRLRFGDIDVACTIGKGGARPAADKREGDGCTPLGIWPVRAVLLRPRRLMLRSMPAIPWRWIRDGDGWSDDPDDPAYNRPVRLPRRYSAERMARDDAAYDAVVVLGHNDAPPVPGMGSAIFFHIEQGRPTEGCVAVSAADMAAILPLLTDGTVFDIR